MDNGTMWLAIITSVLASGGLFTLIQFLITRKDTKKNKFTEISDKLIKIDSKQSDFEKDLCRLQMMVLMTGYPSEKRKLMQLAEHYFVDLHGDWYFSDLFLAWIEDNGMDKPSWFKV